MEAIKIVGGTVYVHLKEGMKGVPWWLSEFMIWC